MFCGLPVAVLCADWLFHCWVHHLPKWYKPNKRGGKDKAVHPAQKKLSIAEAAIQSAYEELTLLEQQGGSAGELQAAQLWLAVVQELLRRRQSEYDTAKQGKSGSKDGGPDAGGAAGGVVAA